MTQAADCSALLEDVSKKFTAFQGAVDGDSKGAQDDYVAASSKSYAQTVFDNFDALNSKAAKASELVGQGYDLSKQIGLMSEGQIQKSLPPVVTVTMANAVALSQAAADAENTKIDLAQLRCDQNTEDAALGSWLNGQSSSVQNTYSSTKRSTCKMVHLLSELQDARNKLDDIRKNGYPIFYLAAKEKKTFAGSYKRTIQFKVDLRMYPVYPDGNGVNGDDQEFLLGDIEGIRLSYNSYFKWSDDPWTTLNLYQAFVSDSRQDDYRCLPPKIKVGGAEVELCVKVDAASSSKITVHSKAKFRYKGDTKTIGLGSTDVPAPFGYLSKVSDMKEKKMQQLQQKFVNRLANVMGVHSELLDKAKQWANVCS